MLLVEGVGVATLPRLASAPWPRVPLPLTIVNTLLIVFPWAEISSGTKLRSMALIPRSARLFTVPPLCIRHPNVKRLEAGVGRVDDTVTVGIKWREAVCRGQPLRAVGDRREVGIGDQKAFPLGHPAHLLHDARAGQVERDVVGAARCDLDVAMKVDDQRIYVDRTLGRHAKNDWNPACPHGGARTRIAVRERVGDHRSSPVVRDQGDGRISRRVEGRACGTWSKQRTLKRRGSDDRRRCIIAGRARGGGLRARRSTGAGVRWSDRGGNRSSAEERNRAVLVIDRLSLEDALIVERVDQSTPGKRTSRIGVGLTDTTATELIDFLNLTIAGVILVDHCALIAIVDGLIDVGTCCGVVAHDRRTRLVAEIIVIGYGGITAVCSGMGICLNEASGGVD